MLERSSNIFHNPINLVRPLTVDPTRRFDRKSQQEKSKAEKARPKTTAATSNTTENDDSLSDTTSTSFTLGRDEEYDTDIDDDFFPGQDYSCIGTYKRACKYHQAVPISEYLRSFEKKQLKLHFYGLDPRGMKAFIPSLTMNQHITKLILSSNSLADEGTVYLSHILRDNTAITEVDLSDNSIGFVGARALYDIFKDNVTINHLKLDGNLFDDRCASLFADLITTTGRLYTLRLSRNKFGPNSGFHLGPALSENTTLELLDLSWNTINGKGAVALIKGVQKNVFLKVLNLSYNGIAGADCGKAWFNAFKENTSLVELDLSHNRLTAEPAVYISKGISKSESLEVLRLAGNPLEAAGCYAILKQLIAKNVEINKLRLIELADRLPVPNADLNDLRKEVQAQRPHLQIVIPERSNFYLVDRVRRPILKAVERFQTLFQRRPKLDRLEFFLAAATQTENPAESRIDDFARLEAAIDQFFSVRFCDEDLEKILDYVGDLDSERFVKTFEHKVSACGSLWRHKTS